MSRWREQPAGSDESRSKPAAQGENRMTKPRPVSRRGSLKLAAGAAALPLVHIRTAGAAGRLSVGLINHVVPTGDAVMKRQVERWAAENKVDIALDFITASGNKVLVTLAAEEQAGTGHDVMAFPTWEVHNHGRHLEPVDDVVDRLQAKYGKLETYYHYLGKIDGHWLAVPTSSLTQYKGPCGRIDYLKQFCGIDPTAMYPAKPVHSPESDRWNFETFLAAAEQCAKGGKPFGIGLGQTSDSVDTAGSIFRAFGAEFVDAQGRITLRSDATRQVLEYMKRLVPFLPPNVFSFDDLTNNRMLIADRTTLIYNPPSAWAVAVRDAPRVAEQCWHFPAPVGPAGRFVPFQAIFWGVWSFSRNKTAGKELIEYLCQREQVHERCDVVYGYDIPNFDSMLDFDVWEKTGPPPGTVYNYPLRPFHNARRSIAGYPAPGPIAVQIYNQALPCNLIAKVTHAGQSIDAAIAWAENELQGYIG
jgi:ABC-type glycerol-3-phosphate transport system substrate-binding protein